MGNREQNNDYYQRKAIEAVLAGGFIPDGETGTVSYRAKAGELSYNPELPREQREFNIEWLRREMKDLRDAMDRLDGFLDTEFIVEPIT